MIQLIALLQIEARDHLGGAVAITLVVVAALAGVKAVLDRLLDRRAR